MTFEHGFGKTSIITMLTTVGFCARMIIHMVVEMVFMRGNKLALVTSQYLVRLDVQIEVHPNTFLRLQFRTTVFTYFGHDVGRLYSH